MGTNLASGIREVSSSAGVPLQVPQVGSMFCLFFSENPVKNYEQAVETQTEHFKTLFRYALKEGIYLPPSPFETCFLSAAHGNEEIARTLEVLTAGIKGL